MFLDSEGNLDWTSARDGDYCEETYEDDQSGCDADAQCEWDDDECDEIEDEDDEFDWYSDDNKIKDYENENNDWGGFEENDWDK